MPAPPNSPARVLLACSGLEHTHRGFESFARECFDQLRDEPRLDLRLIKATGSDGERERAIRAIKRDDRLAKALGRIWGGPLRVEQAAFAFSLQPEVLRTRPDVIYFSEWYTGVALAKLRRLNRRQYALVLSNGSMAASGFEPFDRVHQHTAPAFDYVLQHGADPAKHILLPVAFDFAPSFEPPTEEERGALRDRFTLPRDRMIIISVAALNRWHKRLDYVIEEVARVPEPRPFLLLVGAPEAETEGLRRQAQELLGADGHRFATVPRSEVDLLLRASDAFVLASLAEGLPRALVEAMAAGLPCLAHDYAISTYALGSYGYLGDFKQAGSLTRLLEAWPEQAADLTLAHERHRFVYDSFSWDTLRPQYVEMLAGAVGRRDFQARPMTAAPSAPPLHEQHHR
jgi:glycosyltransferase involved in cell wall biosynthesis